jgi:xylulokinase
MWVKKNEPHIYEKICRIMLPKDYIRYRLTGEFATDVSDASGMQLMDIRKRQFSGEILSRLGIDGSFLCKMYESYEVTGKVTSDASRETFLKAGTYVVGGAGDQAAGAVGSGIVKKGVISSSIGTSGVVFAHSDDMCIDPKGRVHTFCHAVPGKWHVMGVTQAAGLSLKWMRDNFFLQEKETAEQMEKDPYVLMDAEASLVPAGANGLLYLPYLMGERTPHLDPYARGAFIGLSAKHTKSDLLRSVMEGVVFSLRDCLEIIKSMGIEASEVRASGGGGRSMLWRQMQADIFDTGICTVNSPEGPALGAAILAMVGSGAYASVQEACSRILKTSDMQLPDYDRNKVYNKYYVIYKKLYGDLKDDFTELNRIISQK